MHTIALVLLASIAQTLVAAPADHIVESDRDIPVAYDVDVVVVGGTTAGVAAAIEAANAGAKVFLAARRPYLGEDICGTYRLWLDPNAEPNTPLAKEMYAEPPELMAIGKGLPFTYTASLPTEPRHKDTQPPSRLSNGTASDAYKESVEYRGEVEIVCDLGKPVEIGRVHVLLFQRPRDLGTRKIDVLCSLDKGTWQQVGRMKNEQENQGSYIDSSLPLSMDCKARARYVKLIAKPARGVERQLLGEIIIEAADALAAKKGKKEARTPPMPMQVKWALDQALLDANVQFLYGCFATDVLRDVNGYLSGIVMANRSGRQAVRARAIIDATPRGDLARIAGARFRPYPSGQQTFRRIVVGGEPREGGPIQDVREMPSDVQIQDTGSPEVALRDAFQYVLNMPIEDASFPSFAEAEHVARDATWNPRQVGASEMLFQVPPDPMKGRKHVSGEWPGPDGLDLDAFRSADQQRLYVLGPCADVSRTIAEELVDPLNLMAVGRRVGRAAVEEANIHPRPTVVCFGDSITARDYPRMLAERLDDARVLNAGVGGNTTAQGLERIEKDVLAHEPDAVVVLFGTNDSVMPAAGKYRVAIDRYEQNLRDIVRQCRNAGAKVVVCTPPPIVPEPYYARHPKEHYASAGGIEKVIARYRDAAVKVARSMKTGLIDLHEVLGRDLSLLGPCGVHPTALGEERIASLAAEALKPLLPEREAGDTPEGVRVAGKPPRGEAESGEAREFLYGVRPTQKDLPTVESPDQALPILGRYDVVVVGGGTGGAPAGIGAARHGAKTLVLEYQYGLGGVGTLGLIGKYYYGYRGGFTAEIDKGVGKLGGEDQPATPGWNVEWKIEWLRRALRKEGADVWFGTLGCGAVVEEGRVKGVIVSTPQGRGVVLAKVVIDSTGNSDIAAAAGAECVFTDGSHVAVQGTGMPPRKPGASYTNTDYTLTDDADIVDMWRTYVAGREKYKDAYDLGQVIDTRERRRIVGEFVISPLDIYNGRTYPDTIGQSYSNFDTHGYTVHPLFALNPPDKKGIKAFTPYRALLPTGLKGILVTGLGISAHRDAMPILRMQPDIQNQGYAAGTAAAMAVRSGKPLREIDLKALQRHLVEIENLPESVLTDKDNFPQPAERIAEAVQRVTEDAKSLGLILAQPKDAIPALKRAYASTSDEAAKLAYAHILGMFQDGTGLATLIKSVKEAEWDKGWSFKGGGQFGMSLSPLDSRIIALGKIGDEAALKPILEKVPALGPDSEFSHHRAVAVALETLDDPRAAKPLADLLRKPGMSGQAVVNIGAAKRWADQSDANLSRDRSLRELILARALYRCGDYEGVGERILRQYAKDYRGHHARHANAVLQEGK